MQERLTSQILEKSQVEKSKSTQKVKATHHHMMSSSVI